MNKKDLQYTLMSESEFIGQSNPDMEEVVLATFVNYPESYFRVADQLSVREFSTIENKHLYLVIKELSEVSKIDICTVTDKIIKKKYHNIIREAKDGFDIIVHLNGICDRIDSDAHLVEHVKILNGFAKRRELVALSENILEGCNKMKDPLKVIDEISTKIVDIQEMGDVEEFDLTLENRNVYKSLEPRKDGVKSHIQKVDEFIYCFEPTELIILAAAPSMGKTALAMEMFKNQIINDVPAVYFSLEMGTTQLLNRMYAVESDIKLSKIRSRLISTEERKRLDKTIGFFEDKKFWVDDRARALSHITNNIRKYVIRHKAKVVFIDYLQLINCDIGKTKNREQEVATISRTFKELASKLRIPIIALSQINRAIHARANKRPTLGDLRESGAIEQDADMVVFVHRPAYFNIQNALPEIEYAELIFAKGRSTGIGTVEVGFRSSMTKFISATKDEAKLLKAAQLDLLPNTDDFG